jgi:hypothetical protein
VLFERLRQFMMGRNGNDPLNMALAALGVLLALLFAFVPNELYFLHLLCYIPFGAYLFRFFSRNLVKRRQENERFLVWWRKALLWGTRKQQLWQARKTHRFFRCPQCKQKLRLPKGRGKIRITCPKCGFVFEKTT